MLIFMILKFYFYLAYFYQLIKIQILLVQTSLLNEKSFVCLDKVQVLNKDFIHFILPQGR